MSQASVVDIKLSLIDPDGPQHIHYKTSFTKRADMGETEYMSDRCAEEIMKEGELMEEVGHHIALLELREWVENERQCHFLNIDVERSMESGELKAGAPGDQELWISADDTLAKIGEMIRES